MAAELNSFYTLNNVAILTPQKQENQLSAEKQLFLLRRKIFIVVSAHFHVPIIKKVVRNNGKNFLRQNILSTFPFLFLSLAK